MKYQKPATERIQLVGQLADKLSGVIVVPCADCDDLN